MDDCVNLCNHIIICYIFFMTEQEPLTSDINVYLQEIEVPVDPKLSDGTDDDEKAREDYPLPQDDEPAAKVGSIEAKRPPPSIFLRVQLESSGPQPFGVASCGVPDSIQGRLYRVFVNAPFGATVMFGSNASLKVRELQQGMI